MRERTGSLERRTVGGEKGAGWVAFGMRGTLAKDLYFNETSYHHDRGRSDWLWGRGGFKTESMTPYVVGLQDEGVSEDEMRTDRCLT
jgi:hypothetical protein